MALNKRRRARDDNPLRKKERLLYAFKWFSLAAFTITVVFHFMFHPGRNIFNWIEYLGPPEAPYYGLYVSIPTFPFIAITGIIALAIFVLHVETLPRAILTPILKVVTSLGFDTSFRDGRHAMCTPRRESQMTMVSKIALEFPGNLLSDVKTCMIRVFLAPGVSPRVDIKALAAEQGFIIADETVDAKPEEKTSCFVTAVELNRVHAKSLNLRLLLNFLA